MIVSFNAYLYGVSTTVLLGLTARKVCVHSNSSVLHIPHAPAVERQGRERETRAIFFLEKASPGRRANIDTVPYHLCLTPKRRVSSLTGPNNCSAKATPALGCSRIQRFWSWASLCYSTEYSIRDLQEGGPPVHGLGRKPRTRSGWFSFCRRSACLGLRASNHMLAL